MSALVKSQVLKPKEYVSLVFEKSSLGEKFSSICEHGKRWNQSIGLPISVSPHKFNKNVPDSSYGKVQFGPGCLIWNLNQNGNTSI